MTENNARIPKKIKLIVNKGQDLQLYHPKKTIKNQPRKWRVLFHNVVEKMATAKVESDTGNPEWLCEITVTVKNVQDPISLLVTDSKSRHIGQVLIPLSHVPPPPPDCTPDSRPPLVFANIHKSELEPTKKNNYPKGYLYYWMWTIEYWNADEILKSKSKKSLSQSMHDLSNSTLNLFRRKQSTTSFQESELYPNNIQGRFATEVNLKASPLKINNLKKKPKPGSDSSSSVTSQINSQSNLPVHNNNALYSKNPFDAMTITDISFENHISHEEPYQQGTSNNKQPSTSLNHQVSIGSKDSPVSYKKKHGLFSKFRNKKSQSSADLSKIALEAEPSNVFHALPQSLGKQQGQRLFEKKNDFSKSSTDVASWFCGEAPISTTNQNPVINNGSRRLNRPQSCLIRTGNDSYLPNKPPLNHYPEHNGIHDHMFASNTLNGNINYNDNTDFHPTNRNREDMTKRELVDLAALLENQLKTITDRCRNSEKLLEKSNIEKKDLCDDLSIVRDELCRLKLRLLEAGDHKYLEKTQQKTRADVLSDLSLWRANSKL